MKNRLLSLSVLVGYAILSASTFAASANGYDVNVFNLADQAVVKVTHNGQPVKDVTIQVSSGAIQETLTTSKEGDAYITNRSNNARTFKIKVDEPNGQTYTTQRFISSFN